MATILIANEDIIIQLLLQKNEQGLRLLYRQYKDAIFGIISSIVKSEQHAEEVLNDVFLKIYNNIISYDAEKSRLFTWMARIARNASIDKIRSIDYKSSGAEEISTLSDKLRTDILPMNDTVGWNIILNALDGNQKKLIQMVYLLGYTHQECADELQLPLGTVKTNVRRGLLHLKEQFAKDLQTYLGILLFILIYIFIHQLQ